MSHVFDIDTTRKQQILVEYITDTGSGFAVTPQGEQVFLNKRLVDAMKVESGDIYDAFLLPNYPDKQAQIPWRAMRVEKVDVPLDLGHVAEEKSAPPMIRVLDYMRKANEITSDPIEPVEVADELGLSLKEVEAIMKSCDNLIKVDAYVLRTVPN